MPKLYFMIGIQGSGKSTYIKKHFKPEIVVSPDDLRRQYTGDVTNFTQEGKVWANVPILLKQKLEKFGEAVLDATNVDSGDRKRMLKNFNRDSVERIAIVFEADPEESKRRIKADIEAGKDRSNVPPEVVDKFQEKFLRGFNSIKQQFDKVISGDEADVKEEGKVKDFFKYTMNALPNKDIYLNKVTNGMAFKHNNEIYIAIRKFDNSNQWVTQNVKTLEVSNEEEDYILQNSLPYKKKGQRNSVNWRKKELKSNMKTKSEMNEENVEKIRKMVNEEMLRLKEEDADEAEERAKYQAYQDMYLVPQSNWRVKKYTEMYDGNGGMYKGKLGEIHRIQTVEYDFMHTGEVVTECGGETYSLDAQDFRDSFEMVTDEEGLKVNNESLIKEDATNYYLVKLRNYINDNISFIMPDTNKREKGKLLGTAQIKDVDFAVFKFKGEKIYIPVENVEMVQSWKKIYGESLIKENNMNIYDSSKDYGKRIVTLIYDGEFNENSIRDYMKKNYDADYSNYRMIDHTNPSNFRGHENPGTITIRVKESFQNEIKKLVKIKDYFGKNIKGSIERLQEAFLTEETKKNYNYDVVWKFAQSNGIKHDTKENKYLNTEDIYYYGTVKDFYEDKKKSRFKQITHPIDLDKDLVTDHEINIEIAIPYDKQKHTDTIVTYIILPYTDGGEPEDAYLDQDFEDRISGDGYELDEDSAGNTKLLKDIEIELNGKKIKLRKGQNLTHKRQGSFGPDYYFANGLKIPAELIADEYLDTYAI